MERTPLVDLPPELASPQATRPVRYLLGVDGGATKTLAAVLDLETLSVRLGHSGPSNEDAVGPAAAVEALLDAADEAIQSAGVSSEQVGSAVLAVAGTDTDALAEHVRAARTGAWIVVNDVVGAWASATGAGPGVGVIAGTGSNVFGVGPGGEGWRVGGWGHILGDEGSGYWLGLESIKATLHDREASGPATALTEVAPAFFDVDSVEALASLVYSKPLTKGEIAAFTVETVRIAELGDEVARDLVARGGAELGAQVATVIGQTGLSGRFPVGLIGSAFKAGALFVDPLAAVVHEQAPEAQLAAVEMAPVAGSLLLAARACGQSEWLSVAALSEVLDTALAI